MCQVRMPANSEAQAAKMPELVIHSNDHKKLSEMDTAMTQCLPLYLLNKANLENAKQESLGSRLLSVLMRSHQYPSPEMGHECEAWGDPAS